MYLKNMINMIDQCLLIASENKKGAKRYRTMRLFPVALRKELVLQKPTEVFSVGCRSAI